MNLSSSTSGRLDRRTTSDAAERGAASVEYGLLLTGIACAIVSAVVLFGGHVGSSYTDSCSTIEQQATHHACTQTP